MKNAIYAMLFSAAFIGAASAQSTTGQAAPAKAAAPYELAVNEFDDYAKTFVLEDGSRIEFTQHAGNYFAKLERGPKTQLIPQAPGVFMTASGVRIQFRDSGDNVTIRDHEKLAAKRSDNSAIMMAAKR